VSSYYTTAAPSSSSCGPDHWILQLVQYFSITATTAASRSPPFVRSFTTAAVARVRACSPSCSLVDCLPFACLLSCFISYLHNSLLRLAFPGTRNTIQFSLPLLVLPRSPPFLTPLAPKNLGSTRPVLASQYSYIYRFCSSPSFAIPAILGISIYSAPSESTSVRYLKVSTAPRHCRNRKDSTQLL